MKTDADCVFCKIVAGEIPCSRVYEDEALLAFMDIGPIVRGHTLVIPREHIDPVTAADEALTGRLFNAARRIAAAQMNALGADGVNIMQNNGRVAGQAVFHLHVHVIPRFRDDGHHWNWNPGSYDAPSDMQALAENIAAALAA